MSRPHQLDTPWSLRFERDGTEDIGVIFDGNEEELVRSRPFWLPKGSEPIPTTLAALWLVEAAPHLLAFSARIARMTMDGEVIDGREFILENDDAVDTLHELIDIARNLTALAEGRAA